MSLDIELCDSRLVFDPQSGGVILMDGGMDGPMDGRMDKWTDGWADICMDRHMDIQRRRINFATCDGIGHQLLWMLTILLPAKKKMFPMGRSEGPFIVIDNHIFCGPLVRESMKKPYF